MSYFTVEEEQKKMFTQLPKALLYEEKYKPMTNDSKLLYSFLVDRVSLSLKNGYSLTMKLHSESLVKTENNIELKFYLLDEKETPVSFHKVIIISEEEA